MGKRRNHPHPGNRKFHAPKAKRMLHEAPGAASSAISIPTQSSNPEGDPTGMNPWASKNSSGEADPEGIHVREHRDGSPQEGRDKGIGGSGAPGSPKQEISNGMGEDHLESLQLGTLEADGTGEDELQSPKPGILDGAGENCPESPKPGILEVDGAGEEPPESVKHVILDGMGENLLESSQLGISWANGAGEEQLEMPKHGILDGAGAEQPESPKQGILDGMGENHLESSQLGILKMDGAGKEQLESPPLGIPEADGTGEKQLESLKLGILDGTGEDQPEPLKEGIWDGVGENQLESPKQGNSGAHGSGPKDTVMDTTPAESSEVPDAAGEREEGALKEGCGTGIALSLDMGSLACPGDPRSGGGDTESRNYKSGNAAGGNSSTATPGLDPAATSTEPQGHWEGTSPELPIEQPFLDAARHQPQDTTGQIHARSTGNNSAHQWESARATEPADASSVIHGLIRELSDLNRLAMGAHRGLELLRRPKPRRSWKPVPSGSRWKEG